VQDVAPVLAISGAAEGVPGTPYVLNLAAVDPGEDSIVSWEINWGDGNIETVAGNPSSVGHVYSLGGSIYSITASATNEDGTFAANAIDVDLRTELLHVASFTPQASGFSVRFSAAFDQAPINLYSGQMPPFAPMGESDVVVTGEASGTLRGSLVFDADGAGFTFVKTGGVLAPDAYTVRLRSASDGFRGAKLLDGNEDDVAGGDYVTTFTVGASTQPVLSIGDVARGNGQSIDLPATGSGSAVTLSDGVGVSSISFRLRYGGSAGAPSTDALIVSAVELAPALVGVASLSTDTSTPGEVGVTVTVLGGGTLGAGAKTLAVVRGQVGMDAQYGTARLLDLADIVVNAAAGGARDDDGVQVVALLGDTSGNRAYSTLDLQRLQRVNLGNDSGFAAYPNVDPLIIGDISGNGGVSSLDVGRLRQELQFLAALATVATARIEGERLELRTADGALAATLTRSAGD